MKKFLIIFGTIALLFSITSNALAEETVTPIIIDNSVISTEGAECNDETRMCYPCDETSGVCYECDLETGICTSTDPISGIEYECLPETGLCHGCDSETGICYDCDPNTGVCNGCNEESGFCYTCDYTYGACTGINEEIGASIECEIDGEFFGSLWDLSCENISTDIENTEESTESTTVTTTSIDGQEDNSSTSITEDASIDEESTTEEVEEDSTGAEKENTDRWWEGFTGWENDEEIVNGCSDCDEYLENLNKLTEQLGDPALSTETRDKYLQEQFEAKIALQECREATLPDICDVHHEKNIYHTTIKADGLIPYEKNQVPLFIDEEIFPDVYPESPYAKAIYYFKLLDVLSGYPDGTFKPKNHVNRVEALKIIFAVLSLTKSEYNIDSLNTEIDLNFTDTTKGEWYIPYLFSAKAAGIVDGYPDGTFKPADTVNKVEILKMLFEAFGIDVSEVEVDEAPFSDTPINEWYIKYLTLANQLNLLDEESENFNPDQGMTREKVADITYKLLSIYDNTVYTDTSEDELDFDSGDVDSDFDGDSASNYDCIGIVCYLSLNSRGCKPVGETQTTTYREEFSFVKKITIEYKDGSTSEIDGNKEINYDRGGTGKLGDSGPSYIKREILREVFSEDSRGINDVAKITLIIEITNRYRNAVRVCQEHEGGSRWEYTSEQEGESKREIEKIMDLNNETEPNWPMVEEFIRNNKNSDLAPMTSSVKRAPKSECTPEGKEEKLPGETQTFVFIDKVTINFPGDFGTTVTLDNNQTVWNHGEGQSMNSRSLGVASTEQIVNHMEWYIKEIYPTNKTFEDVSSIEVTYRKYVYNYPHSRICVSRSFVQDGETLTWLEWEERSGGMEKVSEEKYSKTITPSGTNKTQDILSQMTQGRQEGYE